MKLNNTKLTTPDNTGNIAKTSQSTATSAKEGANGSLISRMVKTAKNSLSRTPNSHIPDRKGKTVTDRTAEAVNTDTLRLSMRDTRDAARQCMEREDWTGAQAHCHTLKDFSRKAVRMGDEALCNGGLLTLGDLGSEALNNGNTDTARIIADLIADTGKAVIRKGRMGPVRTADVALRQMRHTAQQNFGNEGFADKMLRINMDMFSEHGSGVGRTLLDGGMQAIKNGDNPGLKKTLDDLDGMVRSASRADFPVSLSSALQTLPALVQTAWEAGDTPLANTIILRFSTLSEQAAERGDAEALVNVTLTQNKLSKQADSAGQPHSAALLRMQSNKTVEAAKQLPGGTPTFLIRFPMGTEELSAAATDTTRAAQQATFADKREEATQHIQTLRDIGITMLRKSEPAEMRNIGTQLAEIGRSAAESRNLGLMDVVTDSLTTLADYASRAGDGESAAHINSQHESFADAWSIALKHKGTETEKVKLLPEYDRFV